MRPFFVADRYDCVCVCVYVYGMKEEKEKTTVGCFVPSSSVSKRNVKSSRGCLCLSTTTIPFPSSSSASSSSLVAMTVMMATASTASMAEFCLPPNGEG